MKALQITIITFAWPPRNSIGAHRPLSWAKYWSEAGADVRVLTARKYGYDEPLDLEMPDLPGVDVIEVDYATNYTSFIGTILQSSLGGFLRRVHYRLRRSKSIVRNPREKWLSAALRLTDHIALTSDVVVSTFDPRAVHEIGSAMKKVNPDLIWVADYRDLWSLNHAPSWNPEQRERERKTEVRTVGDNADLVCSVSEELSRKQGEFFAKPWLCVTNGFDVDLKDIQEALATRTGKRSGPLNIVYTGKLYKGLRDPSPLFRVIAEMEQNADIAKGDVQVHLYGGQVDGLAEIMGSGKYDQFVTLHGHVTRDTALRAQRDADLLLLLESPLPEAKGVLTGKIFEYMSSGVPILSLGSTKDSAIGTVLSSTATGMCPEDNPETIRNTLIDIMSGRTPDWFSPDLNVIGTYSRKAQAVKLLAAIYELRSIKSAQV
jgi:glycosyltransferase involved in cell wall biosynthesis